MALERIIFPYNLEVRGWPEKKPAFRLQNGERVVDEDGNKVGEDRIIDVPISQLTDLFPELDRINVVALATIEAQDKEIKELKISIGQLEAAGEDMFAELGTLRPAIEEASRKIPALTEQMRKAKGDNDALMQAGVQRDRLINAAANELDLSKAEIERLNTENAEMAKVVKAANASIEAMKGQLASQASTVNDMNVALRGEREARNVERGEAAKRHEDLLAENHRLGAMVEEKTGYAPTE